MKISPVLANWRYGLCQIIWRGNETKNYLIPRATNNAQQNLSKSKNKSAGENQQNAAEQMQKMADHVMGMDLSLYD